MRTDYKKGRFDMKREEIEPIMDQVVHRFGKIWTAYFEKKYDDTDREISELRDVLDDIYDRPEEKIVKQEEVKSPTGSSASDDIAV